MRNSLTLKLRRIIFVVAVLTTNLSILLAACGPINLSGSAGNDESYPNPEQPTASTDSGEPTASTDSGEPTATTESGEPTATTDSGEPTATTESGDATATTESG